ncbi:MAG: hypothetical protein R2757_10860 [Draconibacterium sp.]
MKFINKDIKLGASGLKLYLLMISLFFIFLVKGEVTPKIDWPVFMAQHDLVWEDLPLQWNEGAFCGNGQLGMMIFVNMKENGIVFQLGRQDVTDHRKAADKKSSIGADGATVMLDYPRLDIGKLILHPAGKIISGTMKLDLWNAEITGKISTDLGEISFTAITHHERMLNIVEVTSTEKKGNLYLPWKWDFRPGNPASPRVQTRPNQNRNKGYVTNPDPWIQNTGAVSVCVQPLLAGGDYATAWTEKANDNKTNSVLYLSIANEVPKSGVSETVAKNEGLEASKVNLDTLKTSHRNWWHQFYPESFLSFPDARMESFYWIQMYKMASASRADGPAIDLLGPFFQMTQWPGIWWNLNLQLTYWPFYASNHVELAENLIRLLDENFEALLATFEKEKLGDLAWALHNYWLYYNYRGDWKSIQEKWVPKATKMVKAYDEMEKVNQAGQFELLPMGSPEYKSFTLFENTNYNLALIRWLLTSLIETNEKFNASQQQVVQWKRKLEKLVPFPVDENGLMIGSNQLVDVSHRHFSHLLALYPLFQLNPEIPENKELCEKSVKHWLSVENGDKLTGFSYAGGAALYAAIGDGNSANQLLQQFLNGDGGKGIVFPNTMYTEKRGKNPTIETPLSAAASITEMFIQSWGNKIRIFPAVPEKWENASFYHLAAQGGFLVSASKEQGKTVWISVKSLTGEPCVIKVPDWEEAWQVSNPGKTKLEKISNGEFRTDLKKGEEILLLPGNENVTAVISPIDHPANEKNYYGVKKGKQLPEDLSWQLPEFKPKKISK